MRQLSEKLLSENIIDRQTFDSFNDTLPSAVSDTRGHKSTKTS